MSCRMPFSETTHWNELERRPIEALVTEFQEAIE